MTAYSSDEGDLLRSLWGNEMQRLSAVLFHEWGEKELAKMRLALDTGDVDAARQAYMRARLFAGVVDEVIGHAG